MAHPDGTPPPAPARPHRSTALIVGLLVALAVALLGVWGFFLRGDDDAAALPSPTGTYEADPALAELPRRLTDDPMALGDVDAPVTMVMYFDYLCAHCQTFDIETMPELQQYVDSGVLRIEARDLVLFGDEAVTAALGARAAANQDEYWTFHSALMAERHVPDAGVVTPDHLEALAQELDLDLEQFRTDLADADGAAWNELVRDGTEVLEFAAPSTPLFVINGVLIEGAVPTEEFVDVIAWAAQQAE